MRRWGILGLGLALGLSLALGSGGHVAWAASEPAHAPAKLVLPRPDPPGHWRYMTQYPPTTTSKCVGQVTTPMCAVDTFEACFVRQDDNLCRIALGLNKLPGMVSRILVPDEWEKYRVLRTGRKPTEPSSEVKIVIQSVDCLGDWCQPSSAWFLPTSFLLRPILGGWKIIKWYTKCFPQDQPYASGC